MFTHAILFVILSALSVSAVYAAGMPMDKPSRDQKQQEVDSDHKDPTNSL